VNGKFQFGCGPAWRQPGNQPRPARSTRAARSILFLCALCVLPALSQAQAGEGCAEAVQAQQPLTLPLERAGSLFFVEAKVNGRAALLLVDTGAERSILHDRTRNAVRGGYGTYQLQSADVTIQLGETFFAPRRVGLADLSALRRKYRAALDRDFDGVLGMDVLREFDAVTFDFKARALRLVQEAR